MSALRKIWNKLLADPAAPPVALLSFNRPAYLRLVIESLRAQRPAIDERRIHLFQDGAVNAYSGRRHAEDSDIAQSVDLFRQAFPRGHLHISPVNLGIAENFRRAETYMFIALGADFTYFFEDDLVLSRHYVAALDTMRRHFADKPEIAYFNACGIYTASIEEQQANRHKLVPMGHNWGFALRRSSWFARQPLMDQYYVHVIGRDYRERDHKAIFDLFRRWGVDHRLASSQDRAKQIASELCGHKGVSCFPAFGQYIGVLGTHFNEDVYRQHRFDRTILHPAPLPKLPRNPEFVEMRPLQWPGGETMKAAAD